MRSTRSPGSTFQNRCSASVMSGSAAPTSWRAGVVLVLTRQHGDGAVERRREQHRLAVLVRLVEQLAHLREEAHVGHAVGFVDHDRRHRVEADRVLLDEVEQPARTGDEHVDTLAQRAALRVVADAAVHGVDAAAARPGQRLELALDLGCELTRRSQDQRARASSVPPGRSAR